MIKFTIITVCLNAGEELKRTIESILNQDYKNFYILIKDGLSIDNSVSAVPKDNRIIIIKEKDDGIYDAMNQALKYASGDYILFLNAGDYFYDKYVLKSFYNSIINNNYPELIYCDYITSDLNQYVHSPHSLSRFYLFRTMLCHQVCMVKRICYETVGIFNTELKVVADYDFLLRLLLSKINKYYHFHKIGILYKSKGFSYKNKQLKKIEISKLRKKYFKKYYYLYKIIYSLTFPTIRDIIVERSGKPAIIYQKVINYLNKRL